MKISLVPITKEHHPFIISNWLRQYRAGSYHPLPDAEIYYTDHQEIIKHNIAGIMAVNQDDTEQYLGFACGNPDACHFIFVKELFRSLGIGAALYKSIGSPKQYSHHTKCVRSKLRGMVYNPYLFTKDCHDEESN